MESLTLQDYLFQYDDSFNAFLSEAQKRYGDPDLKLYYELKDEKRSISLNSPRSQTKGLKKYKDECIEIFKSNPELQKCIKPGFKFLEVGSAPGGQVPKPNS